MSLAEIYHHYWTENADPRTNDWPLIGSPWPMMTLIFLYLFFIYVAGPNYMKGKKPYDLKWFIQLFDAFQIVANFLIVKGFIDGGWYQYPWIYCVPYSRSYEPGAYLIAKVFWWTLLVKMVDFVETGVFVLRKKNNQVSFLHVYHHITTLLIQWLATKYIASGMCIFIVLLNSAVHVIMYTYYLLSSFGPTVQKIIAPIKPHITKVQMIQFVVMVLFGSQALSPNCDIPKTAPILMIINLLINLYLFYDFYRKNYIKTNKKVT